MSKAPFFLVIPALVMMLGSVVVLVLVLATPTKPLFNIALLQVNPASNDGPSVWMGVFSSCSRINSSVTPSCTKPTIPPRYNFSVLSKVNNTASLDAATLPSSIVGILGISLALSILFLLLSCWWARSVYTYRELFDPRVQAMFGPVGILVGLCCGIPYFLLYMSYGRIILIFNDSQGQYTNLVAKPGKSLPLVVVGCSLFVLTLHWAVRIIVLHQ